MTMTYNICPQLGINFAFVASHERIGDRPSDADGLWCAVPADGFNNLEQPLSNCGSADRVIVEMNSDFTRNRTFCGRQIPD